MQIPGFQPGKKQTKKLNLWTTAALGCGFCFKSLLWHRACPEPAERALLPVTVSWTAGLGPKQARFWLDWAEKPSPAMPLHMHVWHRACPEPAERVFLPVRLQR